MGSDLWMLVVALVIRQPHCDLNVLWKQVGRSDM